MRAPKQCGKFGCLNEIREGKYCDDHRSRWEGGRRPAPSNWKTLRLSILNRDGRVCYRCGHGDADEVDHRVPTTQGGSHDPANLGAIHGGRCPTCQRKCHKEKTAREAASHRVPTSDWT